MNTTSIKRLAALALCGLLTLPTMAASPAGDYEIAQTLRLGAATKWDYAAIDVSRQRLYVTRGDRVDVVQLPAGNQIGSIPNTPGVHGVAFAPDQNLGFTSNGKSNSVSVFELGSLKKLTEIAVSGKNPDAVLYEAAGNKLYVFNGGSASVDVIDVARLELVATLPATGRPEFAVSDGHGKIYFNVEDRAELSVIDTAAGKLIATWPLPGCEEPTGLAIDTRHARLFSSCANGVMAVTDASNGQHVAQFGIGKHPDAVIFDADTKTVLTSCGGEAGSLTITDQIDADHYAARTSLVTAKGAKTMAMNPVDKTVYLPTVVDNTFVVMVAARKR